MTSNQPVPTAIRRAAAGGNAPTFVEKPKIVTKEEGKLIMLLVKYRSESMCELLWSFQETRIVETKTIRIVHERIEDYFEARLELTVQKHEILIPTIPPPLFQHDTPTPPPVF